MMRQERIERALRTGPPFRPMPIPAMPLTSEPRSSTAGWRRFAVLLTVVFAAVLATIAVSLYQTARNVGSPESRVTIQVFPVAVSFNQASVQSLRLVEGTAWKKAWSDSNHTGPARRGVVLAYAPEPEVHQCGGVTARVVVRRDPMGLLLDLEGVAGFDVRDIERRSVGGRSAASALVIGPSCGADVHLQQLPGLTDDSLTLEISGPTFLTAVDVDGETVLLQLWAQTEEDLVQWIGEMGPMLDSMRVDRWSRP